jgi:hypothetical protein
MTELMYKPFWVVFAGLHGRGVTTQKNQFIRTATDLGLGAVDIDFNEMVGEHEDMWTRNPLIAVSECPFEALSMYPRYLLDKRAVEALCSVHDRINLLFYCNGAPVVDLDSEDCSHKNYIVDNMFCDAGISPVLLGEGSICKLHLRVMKKFVEKLSYERKRKEEIIFDFKSRLIA